MKGEYNMKKNYITPEFEKIVFSVSDVITVSGGFGPDLGDGGLPVDPASINDVQGIDDNIDLMS